MWPVSIGLLCTFGIMFYREMMAGEGGIRQAWQQMNWTYVSVLWILLGFFMMVMRDAAYIWRMRLLSDKQLSWRSSFDVILLWEFASAVSPSAVGGSAVAVFLLAKEKVSMGRSTALVFITIFLDEAFYLLIVPLGMLFIPLADIFAPVANSGGWFGSSLIVTFWTAYIVIFCYTCFLAMALFIFPHAVHRVVKKLFLTKALKRWHRRGFKMAEDLLIASEEFRTKPIGFWIKASLATLFAWLSRYWVLNCVLAAFAVSAMGLHEHLLAFARQAVMFIMMLISPTPGSSGVAEFMFTTLLEDMTPAGLEAALAAVWRLISYYPYLFLGLFLLPRWLLRVQGKKVDDDNSNSDNKNGPQEPNLEPNVRAAQH